MVWSLPRALLATSVLLAALAPAASSQEVLFAFGGAGDAHSGWCSGGVGDINGDNFPDLILGAPEDNLGGDEAGRALLLSGRDGSVLFDILGESSFDHFGEHVAGTGDVDQDGTPDFLVGVPFGDGNAPGSGYAVVLSGLDASLIYRFNGDETGDTLGDTCEAAGDVNADGWIDLIVGGRGHDGNGVDTGIARVFSGLDGSELYSFIGTSTGALAGSVVDGVGDIDADGFDDVGVGAKGTTVNGLASCGQALIFSGFDGSLLRQIDGREAGDGLGKGLAGLGDVNADGVLDIAIGAWQVFNPSPNATGFGQVQSADDLTIVYKVIGDKIHDSIGVWVSSAGDADSDGHPDVAIGGPHYDFGGFFNAGRITVLSGIDGSLIYEVFGEGEGDGLGHHTADAGDVNQDGYDDLIAGAYWNDFGGHDAGRTYVFSGCPAVLERLGGDLAGSNGLPPNLAGCGLLEGGDPLTFRVINAPPSSVGALIIGLTEINLPFKGGLCVPSPDWMIFLPTTSAGSIDVAATWPNNLPPGFSTYYQFWISDPGAPTGFAASNAVLTRTP